MGEIDSLRREVEFEEPNSRLLDIFLSECELWRLYYRAPTERVILLVSCRRIVFGESDCTWD